MSDEQNQVVTVTFNYKAGEDPEFVCNPDPAEVTYGDGDSVTWNLTGTSGAQFNDTEDDPGVYFPEDDDPQWPGPQPSRVTDTQWQVTFDNAVDEKTAYAYYVNVLYNNQVYCLDPTVEEDPESSTEEYPDPVSDKGC